VSATRSESNFDSDRHALYVGWVIGIALQHGIDVTPEFDVMGNYTDRIMVSSTDVPNLNITVVIPPPPEHWSPT